MCTAQTGTVNDWCNGKTGFPTSLLAIERLDRNRERSLRRDTLMVLLRRYNEAISTQAEFICHKDTLKSLIRVQF